MLYRVGLVDVRLNADFIIEFHGDGSVSRGLLFNNTFFRVCGKKVKFCGGEWIEFNIDGSVASGSLLNDTFLNIGGVRFKFENESVISFHRNGVVKDGRLLGSVNIEVCGEDYEVLGDYVRFHDNGVVRSCYVRNFGYIEFDRSGLVKV